MSQKCLVWEVLAHVGTMGVRSGALRGAVCKGKRMMVCSPLLCPPQSDRLLVAEKPDHHGAVQRPRDSGSKSLELLPHCSRASCQAQRRHGTPAPLQEPQQPENCREIPDPRTGSSDSRSF